MRTRLLKSLEFECKFAMSFIPLPSPNLEKGFNKLLIVLVVENSHLNKQAKPNHVYFEVSPIDFNEISK